MTEPEPVLDDEFAAAIGRLTLSWAMLEAGLDFCILAIYRHHEGALIYPKEPVSLKNKLAFLKKAFNARSVFDAQLPTLRALISAVGQASNFRNDIIHGFAVERLGQDQATAELVRLLRDGGGYRPRRISVSAERINQEAVKVNGLALPWGRLANVLLSST